jgi:hypothetical protein
MSKEKQKITRRMIESEQVRDYEKCFIGGLLVAIQKSAPIEKNYSLMILKAHTAGAFMGKYTNK